MERLERERLKLQVKVSALETVGEELRRQIAVQVVRIGTLEGKLAETKSRLEHAAIREQEERKAAE